MDFEKAESSSLEYFQKFNSALFNTPHATRADFVLDQSGHLFTFSLQLITMQETRNLHQGELENIAVFSDFREIQF
jgi:hypothetical protein